MPVENVSSLIQNLSDQLFGQGQNNVAPKGLLSIASPVTPAAVEDTFTPSAQNGSALVPAQDTALFQFAPGTLTASQNNATSPVTHGAIPLLSPTPGSATTKPDANGVAAQSHGNTPAGQATNGAASSANLQLQIQSLNASLPALGLTNTEINQIDRIATLVQNFNPAAYANLVSQFEALAQNSGTPTAANQALLSGLTAQAGTSTVTQTIIPDIMCRESHFNLRGPRRREQQLRGWRRERNDMDGNGTQSNSSARANRENPIHIGQRKRTNRCKFRRRSVVFFK